MPRRRTGRLPAQSPVPPDFPTPHTVVTHDLGLGPADWLVATWRPRQPLTRPTAEPFDQAACAARLARMTVKHNRWNWHECRLPAVLSRPEAHFWWVALTEADPRQTPAELARQLAGRAFDGHVPAAEAAGRFTNMAHDQVRLRMVLLANLLPPLELLGLVQDPDLAKRFGYHLTGMLDWVVEHVVPYLTDEEVGQLRRGLDGRIDPKTWPASTYGRPPAAFELAAVAGRHADMLAVVESWANNRFGKDPAHGSYQRAHRILFGLGDPALVERHGRRLGLWLQVPEHVRGWLAHTERKALDFVRDSIQRVSRRPQAEALLRAFVQVRAPEAAPYLLELRRTASAPKLARVWLEREVGNAIAGLLPVAAGSTAGAADAIDYLREVKRRGLAEVIEGQLAAADPEVADAVRRTVLDHPEPPFEPFATGTTPDWLACALAEVRPIKLPDWLRPAVLPAVVVGDQRLNQAQVGALLSALKLTGEDKPPTLSAVLKERADAASLEAFAWKVADLWEREAAPASDKWAVAAVGRFGGPASVRRLTELLRAKSERRPPALIAAALACLHAISSDPALYELSEQARLLRAGPNRDLAVRLLEESAKSRGLSRDDLEDLLLPTLGLGGPGERVFDYGRRQFRFVFGPNLTPLLRDPSGKLRPDLLDPGVRDDATKAATAKAEWRTLKQQLRTTFATQAERLQKAMLTGRRWRADHFADSFLRHPLLGPLGRLLLWAGHDADGRRVRTFRVTEEGFADSADHPCTLERVAAVGLVHPAHLGADERSVWGEVFADYELVQPFPQLGRLAFAPLPGEEQAVMRFDGVKVQAWDVMRVLAPLGWRRRYAGSTGMGSFGKTLAGLTAVVEYQPGWYQPKKDVTVRLGRCILVKGVPRTWAPLDPTHLLPLGEVDPLVLSEVVGDLNALAAKGA